MCQIKCNYQCKVCQVGSGIICETCPVDVYRLNDSISSGGAGNNYISNL
jgi:hypothetical protein